MVILEYCSKVDYRTVISNLNIQHEKEVAHLEQKFGEGIQQLEQKLVNKEEEYKNQIAHLRGIIEELKGKIRQLE
jgi:predicted transcriptional regulator